MRRDLPRFAALGRFATASALALTLLGCEASSSGPSAPASTPPATDAAPPPMGGEAPPPAGGTTPAPAERAFESARANLRFKGAARLREEFARILQLPTDAL